MPNSRGSEYSKEGIAILGCFSPCLCYYCVCWFMAVATANEIGDLEQRTPTEQKTQRTGLNNNTRVDSINGWNRMKNEIRKFTVMEVKDVEAKFKKVSKYLSFLVN